MCRSLSFKRACNCDRQAFVEICMGFISFPDAVWEISCVPCTLSGPRLAAVKPWLLDSVCFPMKSHLLLAVHLKKKKKKGSLWIGHWPRRPAPRKHPQWAPGLLMPLFLWAPLTVPWQGQIASTAPYTKTFQGPWLSDGDARFMVLKHGERLGERSDVFWWNLRWIDDRRLLCSQNR